MEDEWASDGLDEALASVCELAENSPQPLIIELSSEEAEYYDWNRQWETQNLNNGLFSERSNPSFVDDSGRMDHSSKQGQQLPAAAVSEPPGNVQTGSSEISDWRCTSGKPVELSSSVRTSSSAEASTTSGGTCDVLDSAASQHKRRILGENTASNKRLRTEDGEAKVPAKEKGMGGIAPNSVLSAGAAIQMQWRNGVFAGRSPRDLYKHCNGVVSHSQRFIHDIIPDADGRRIGQLLE